MSKTNCTTQNTTKRACRIANEADLAFAEALSIFYWPVCYKLSGHEINDRQGGGKTKGITKVVEERISVTAVKNAHARIDIRDRPPGNKLRDQAQYCTRNGE